MAKRVKAWYDKKWLMPALAILTFLSMPFREDIRKAVGSLGLMLDDRLFDILLAGALVGLAVVLVLKCDRAVRACEDLREHLQEDLSNHRKHLKKELGNHRKNLKKDLGEVVDSKLKPVTDGIGPLQSNVIALGTRIGALESSITALKSAIKASAE